MQKTPLKPLFQARLEEKESANQGLSNNVKVNCKLKPLLSHEVRSKIEIDRARNEIVISDPTKSINKNYKFDRIFDETVSQEEFTSVMCAPLVKELENGVENKLFLSYGITNSGKTHTILGTPEQPGLLLSIIKELRRKFPDDSLKIVAIELYKDEFWSLKNKGEKLHPKEVRGILSFEDCGSDEISPSNMNELFEKYLQNRSSSSTSSNSVSSRSHAIFIITGKNFKIGVVDLAGSERTSKNPLDQAVDLKETIFINKSLLGLKKCINALEERAGGNLKVTIPYRESKLTQCLMEFFVGRSSIEIILNLNQALPYLEQNLNAMDYTSRAKNITANATSDFSKMFKSTIKKNNEIISGFKSKLNSQSQSVREEKLPLSQQHGQLVSENRFIINEEKQEAEEQEYIEEEKQEKIQQQEELIQLQNQLMFQELAYPVSIEDFIEKQRLFREVYLETDMAIQREADERQLSALRKVNLWETTEKKPESKARLANPVETAECGTEILGGELWNEEDELNEKLAEVRFEQIRTDVKKRLMKALDEDKKKLLVDAETMWSERKSQFKEKEKLEMNRIEESNNEDDQSNYTTPGKKQQTSSKSVKKSNKNVQQSVNRSQMSAESFKSKPNIFSVVKSGTKSAFNKIGSVVKSGASYLGFGAQKSIFKQKGPRFNLQMTREIELLIKPTHKLVYEIATKTEVEIVASSKKVSVLERVPVMSADGEIEIDAEPIVVKKEIVVETFDVAIQTDEIETKYVLQEVIKESLEEETQNTKKENNKKKKNKAWSVFSEASTEHEAEDQDTVETQEEKPKFEEEKPKFEEKKQSKKPTNQKRAFKNFSVNKRKLEVSVKKHKAMVSAYKTGIAKHTRAAQKKKANN